MKEIVKYIFILLLVLVLSACTNESNKKYIERDFDESDYDYEEELVVGYTSRGTPIIKETDEEIEWNNTWDSTCFSKIGYDDDNETLYLIFRDSGSEYRYLDFPYSEWLDFSLADSKGGYYNKYIKGYYYCEKIDKEIECIKGGK